MLSRLLQRRRLQPNCQVPAGTSHWREKTLRSGAGQIELHLDAPGREGVRRDADRADRATSEQVLDPRTRLILFQLMQRGVFDALDGCISTGKEANVYHARCADGESLAVKVYKTSILTFKDRDRYVTGEFRYVPLLRACVALYVDAVSLQLSQWLCAAQSAQDGRNVGREGDAQPTAYASNRPPCAAYAAA